MPDQPLQSTSSEAPFTGKNIVICCDGTGNEFCGFPTKKNPAANSNVVKLYAALDLSDDKRQVAYYHPGVGTMGAATARNTFEKKWTQIKGLAFGAGFRDNVFDAYRFLMDTYEPGDRVFLFGFSRGAYTVRALSGLLHGYGLLRKGNEGHLAYAWRDFTLQVEKIGNQQANDAATARHSVNPQDAFQQTFSHPVFNIHFVGLWDTVSSVGWIYTPLRLLYTAKNPIISTARHAVSIDERRCFFRDNLYGDPLPDQDILQVWFAGVHSDVGGSYPQLQSALSNITLEWMLKHAKDAQIAVDPDRENLIFGRPTMQEYAAQNLFFTPEAYWNIHKSLHGAWWILEFFPHRYFNKSSKKQNWRIPLGVRRHIPPDSIVHPSVIERMQQHPYRPPNLAESRLSPLQTPPPGTTADLSNYYVYTPDPAAAQPASGAKTAAGAAAAIAAVAAFGIGFLLKKLL